MTLKKKRKRFTSEKTAKSFAKRVKGQFNDLRGDEKAKSNFSVTYKKQTYIKSEENFPESGYPEKYFS